MYSYPRAVSSLLCLFLCSVLFGCSDAVLIQVDGRPENTRALRVSATLDGVGIGQDPLLLTPAPSRVVLKDLPSQQGELEVRIEALVDQCIVASGTARLQVSLPSLQWTVASVHLDPLSPKHCPVAVELHGMTANLTLTAQPPARFDCPQQALGFRRCQAYFPVGEKAQINLQGPPEGAFIHRSYPHQASDPPQALPYSIPVEEIQEEPQRDLDQTPPNTLVLRIVNTKLPTGYTITGLWGTREEAPVGDSSFAYEHLWAVGDSGDGGGFIAELGRDGILLPVYKSKSRLNAISGRHAIDRKPPTLWAIGDGGTILRTQDVAGKWEDLTTQSADQTGGKNLNALWIDKDTGDTWIVGDEGTVLRSGDGVSPVGTVTTPFASGERLRTVAGLPDQTLFLASQASGGWNRHLLTVRTGVDTLAGKTPSTVNPYIAALQLENSGEFVLSTPKALFACLGCIGQPQQGMRTSLWRSSHDRVWSGGDSLAFAEGDPKIIKFQPFLPEDENPDHLTYPILTGHGVANTPFSTDIWVVSADGVTMPISFW